MITVTIPSFNYIISAKEGRNILLYIILWFSFFSSCEKNVFISDRLAAETKIASTWHVQNEWMNEWTQAILKWNKYNCENIVTEQTYPGLRYPWIVFARHWTKITVLLASFWGRWFPGAGFACLDRHIGCHGSVLTWKYIWIWHSRRSA